MEEVTVFDGSSLKDNQPDDVGEVEEYECDDFETDTEDNDV